MRTVLTIASVASGIAAVMIVAGGNPMEIAGLGIVSVALSLAASVMPAIRRRSDDRQVRRG
jgi:hypothetical protein